MRHVIACAMAAHAANMALCAAHGDFSHKPWDDTPEEIKRSAIDGVVFVLSNPGVTPKDMHDNWMRYKFAQGWTPGPVKDLEKREHPNLVEFHMLSAEEQAKDHVFVNVVRATYAALIAIDVEVAPDFPVPSPATPVAPPVEAPVAASPAPAEAPAAPAPGGSDSPSV